jgi:hypothetical protein
MMVVGDLSNKVYTTMMGKSIRDIKDASKAFEAILWGEILKESFNTLGEPFLRGKGEFAPYRDMMIWFLSDYVANSYDTGVGRVLYEKLSRFNTTTEAKERTFPDDKINRKTKKLEVWI